VPVAPKPHRGDQEEEGADVALITQKFWRNRLGSDPNVIGRTVQLNQTPHQIVGVMRTEFEQPVPYPTSCSPQAWAAASPLLFLRTLLRFEPDIRNAKLHLAPAVPDWIGTLRLDNIPLMGGQLAVEVEGEIVRTLHVPEGLTIVSDPRLATR